MSVTQQAEALAGRGEIAAARPLLDGAAARGDVDALHQLAIWHLVGAYVPRDLAVARGFLRRAVAIGHVDAALMEVALTANGSGGSPDWPGALRLLETAAVGDPLAAEHLALVRAMDLAADGAPRTPPRGKRLSEAPEVVRFPALLTPAECAHLAQAVADIIEPSVVLDPTTGRPVPHPVRTSDGAVIGPTRESLVVRALNLRIAAASGTGVDQGEPLQVLRYAPGQQYHPHHDAIARTGNQRGWTMLVYLNQGYRGGGTRFTETGLTVEGQGGDGLLFRNLDDAGRPDPLARHAGLPVEAGVKWLATRWIRLGPHDPWTAKPAQ